MASIDSEPAKHMAYVDSAFTTDGYIAGCSCGWTSEHIHPQREAAMIDGQRHVLEASHAAPR